MFYKRYKLTGGSLSNDVLLCRSISYLVKRYGLKNVKNEIFFNKKELLSFNDRLSLRLMQSKFKEEYPIDLFPELYI